MVGAVSSLSISIQGGGDRMIVTLLIKLVGGIFAGVGGFIGKKHVAPKLISIYKKAKNALRRRKGKGGSRKKR